MEHTNSCQYLALAIKSQFPDEYKDINLEHVNMLFSVHELEEAIIPDYTPIDGINKSEKRKQGKAAVDKLLGILGTPDNPIVTLIADLIEEWEDRKTKDARFAKQVDSLDAAIQCKIYDEQGHIDLTNPKAKECQKKEDVLGSGFKTLSDYWIDHRGRTCDYDATFKYLVNNLLCSKKQ